MWKSLSTIYLYIYIFIDINIHTYNIYTLYIQVKDVLTYLLIARTVDGICKVSRPIQ